MSSTFDPQELLDALREQIGVADGDGLTTVEVADALHIGRQTADRLLNNLWRTGQLETCRKMMPTRSGYRKLQPAYRLKEERPKP